MKIKFISNFMLLFFIFNTFIFGEDIARVMKASGDVTLKTMGSATFNIDVKPGQAVNNGDVIHVGEQGFAVVIFIDDRSIVKVKNNTEFQFVESASTRTLNMEYGTILNNVQKEGRNKTYRVETPVSVASVKGTEFACIIDASGVDTFIGKSGQFNVFNQISGVTIAVAAGQKAISNSLGQLIPAAAQPGDYPEDPEFETGEIQEEKVQEDQGKIEEEPQKTEIEEAQIEKTEQTQIQPPEPQAEPDVIEEEAKEPEKKSDEKSEKKQKPYKMGLGIGSATIDGQIYNQLALRPELTFGKLGIGLDIVVYIDSEGNFRKDEWDEASDFFDKFLYVRWAQKTDPFWFKFGALSDVTLGYGGLLAGYSNMMEFPTIRRVGLNIGVNRGAIGTEVFLANVKDLKRGGTIMGLRGTYKISKTFPLTLGVNYVADLNQFSGLKDSDGDQYPDIFDDFSDDKHLWNDTDGDGLADKDTGGDREPEIGWDIDGDGDNILDTDEPNGPDLKPLPFSLADNKATVQGFTLDLGYPILNKDMFALEVYTEYNKLIFPEVSGEEFNRPNREGTGITIPGLRAKMFKFLNVSFEYRIKKDYFVTQFFDRSYDLNRVTAGYEGDVAVVNTKDQYLFEDDDAGLEAKGYYGSASAGLFNLASFSASYGSMKAGKKEFNSFSANLTINAENIPKLSVAQAYYIRNNDKNPFDFGNPSENTILGYRLGYEVSQGVSLIWDFSQYYRDTGTGLEPIKQTTIETAFDF